MDTKYDQDPQAVAQDAKRKDINTQMIETEDSSVYAVLDFETTGLNPNQGDRAIEIGISLFSAGKELDTFSSLINPGRRIDPFITHLTGISNKMLTNAPSAQVVIPKALDFIGEAQLVAHNASFDRKFWRNELQHTLGMDDNRDFICTLMLSRRIFQSFSSHKLGQIALELCIAVKSSHRALDDAQVTAEVLAIMLERLQIAHPGVPVDTQFLHSYQRKIKSSLPDLTTESQSSRVASRAMANRSDVKHTKRRQSKTSASFQ